MNIEKNVKKIIEWFKENEDVFNECIEELDSYDGYLGDDRYYYMEELDELYSCIEPTEILMRAFFGYDEETNGNFNPNREYFKHNGYGNLVSSDSKDYSAFCDRYAVYRMSENRRYIDSIDANDELSELFDKIEEEVENDEA